jgi:hypothetical protein
MAEQSEQYYIDDQQTNEEESDETVKVNSMINDIDDIPLRDTVSGLWNKLKTETKKNPADTLVESLTSEIYDNENYVDEIIDETAYKIWDDDLFAVARNGNMLDKLYDDVNGDMFKTFVIKNTSLFDVISNRRNEIQKNINEIRFDGMEHTQTPMQQN